LNVYSLCLVYPVCQLPKPIVVTLNLPNILDLSELLSLKNNNCNCICLSLSSMTLMWFKDVTS
ncbi:hypothetical protein PDJAM_G00052060, partial [Pangasius djambal]|nr:hypothetical protein [Pangasius djambal]